MTKIETGETLKEARARLALSAQGLADALRLGTGGGRTIRRWESGESPVPGPVQVAVEFMIAQVSK